MIAIEPPRRHPLPDWAVWSLMAGLCMACGRAMEAECALINLVGAVTDSYASAERRARRG